MGALQAQDHAASLWAIGVRADGTTRADVERAVLNREIARTWPMRGTLHWVSAEDLSWMVDLMAPRAMAKSAGRHRQLEIDDEVKRKARNLIVRRLSGGAAITRAEAYALFNAEGLRPDGQRGIYILSCLAHEGTICFGPHSGRQPTFVLVDEWLPPQRRLTGDDALAELARRYFTSHGPATAHDFAWWTGLTVRGAQTGLDAVRPGLERFQAEGKELWFAPAPSKPRSTNATYLLPGFDEFILGYTDRSAIVSPEQSRRLIPGTNGMFLASIVSGRGEVLGAWQKKPSRKGIDIQLEFFDGRSAPASLGRATRRYAAFLGTPVSAASTA